MLSDWGEAGAAGFDQPFGLKFLDRYIIRAETEIDYEFAFIGSSDFGIQWNAFPATDLFAFVAILRKYFGE